MYTVFAKGGVPPLGSSKKGPMAYNAFSKNSDMANSFVLLSVAIGSSGSTAVAYQALRVP